MAAPMVIGALAGLGVQGLKDYFGREQRQAKNEAAAMQTAFQPLLGGPQGQMDYGSGLGDYVGAGLAGASFGQQFGGALGGEATKAVAKEGAKEVGKAAVKEGAKEVGKAAVKEGVKQVALSSLKPTFTQQIKEVGSSSLQGVPADLGPGASFAEQQFTPGAADALTDSVYSFNAEMPIVGGATPSAVQMSRTASPVELRPQKNPFQTAFQNSNIPISQRQSSMGYANFGR